MGNGRTFWTELVHVLEPLARRSCASLSVVRDHDHGLQRTWGGAAADARAQSSGSCVRSSTDVRGKHRRSRRLTRARSSERNRDLPTASSAAPGAWRCRDLRMPSVTISAGVQPASSSSMEERFRWPRTISSLLSAASPTSSGRVTGPSPFRRPISIDGRRMSVSCRARLIPAGRYPASASPAQLG